MQQRLTHFKQKWHNKDNHNKLSFCSVGFVFCFPFTLRFGVVSSFILLLVFHFFNRIFFSSVLVCLIFVLVMLGYCNNVVSLLKIMENIYCLGVCLLFCYVVFKSDKSVGLISLICCYAADFLFNTLTTFRFRFVFAL